jgi:hypothetical protein
MDTPVTYRKILNITGLIKTIRGKVRRIITCGNNWLFVQIQIKFPPVCRYINQIKNKAIFSGIMS